MLLSDNIPQNIEIVSISSWLELGVFFLLLPEATLPVSGGRGKYLGMRRRGIGWAPGPGPAGHPPNFWPWAAVFSPCPTNETVEKNNLFLSHLPNTIKQNLEIGLTKPKDVGCVLCRAHLCVSIYAMTNCMAWSNLNLPWRETSSPW